MRYIDISKIVVTREWVASAEDALASATAADPANRPKAINQHRKIWSVLKPALASESSQKCWYCESINDRTDNAVDHYRPKNSVKESDAMACGYWWLAFNLDNFRFACTFCNSRRIDGESGTTGGKHDNFPLYDEANRATCETDPLDNEQPLLLDPCKASDPSHLWFNEDGTVSPNPTVCGNESSYPYTRTKVSISLLHLDHTRLTERRKALCLEIRRLAQTADKFQTKYINGDNTAKAAFDERVLELRQKCCKESELSLTARCMLKGMRGNSPTAEAVLDNLA